MKKVGKYNFIIRTAKAKNKDKKEWFKLRKKLWPKCSLQKHNDEISEIISNKSMSAFLAIGQEGKAIGFVETSIRPYAEGCNTKNVGYIEGLYVVPNFRKFSIGKKLVHTAERWAISKGCKEMASDCLLNNKISLDFHLALGYKITKKLIHFKKSLKS